MQRRNEVHFSPRVVTITIDGGFRNGDTLHAPKPKDDDIFRSIDLLASCVGLSFSSSWSKYRRAAAFFLVTVNLLINIYFMLYVTCLAARRILDNRRIASNLGMTTYTLQATFSTAFLVLWQSSGETRAMLQKLKDINNNAGISERRSSLRNLTVAYSGVIAIILAYNGLFMYMTVKGNVAHLDTEVAKGCGGDARTTFVVRSVVIYLLPQKIDHCAAYRESFGSPRFFLVFQVANTYVFVCWAIALYSFVLLVHATHYEFIHFNRRLGELNEESVDGLDDDRVLNARLHELSRQHKALIECVKRLNHMFQRYAFLMIATVIPTTIFALVMAVKRSDTFQGMLLTFPIVAFCFFSFFAVTNAPSQLHDTINETKSALCSNTRVWFPYRSSVYHSALAFVAHVDQANIGISIWGFAIVSKPLTLSVMVTCLALFLQLGDLHGKIPTNSTATI